MKREIARFYNKGQQGIRLLNYYFREQAIQKNRANNIIMLHFGRCGSTILANLLCQHKDIYFDGEIYEEMRNKKLVELKLTKDPKKILNIRVNKVNRRHYLMSFKPYYEQHLHPSLLNMNLEDFILKLKEFKFNKYIVLKRKNYLRQIISSELGAAKKQYHIGINEKPQKTEITLNPDKIYLGFHAKTLMEIFEYFDNIYNKLFTHLKGAEVLELIYEDDILHDPIEAYKKTCNFLNIEAKNPEIHISRGNIFSNREVLKNFEEIENLMKNTKYEWMLYSDN